LTNRLPSALAAFCRSDHLRFCKEALQRKSGLFSGLALATCVCSSGVEVDGVRFSSCDPFSVATFSCITDFISEKEDEGIIFLPDYSWGWGLNQGPVATSLCSSSWSLVFRRRE